MFFFFIFRFSKQLSGPDSTQRPQANQNASLEDSWFWEPEPETSSTSSKRDDNGNEGNESPESTTNDLTSIPLDSNYAEINEKLRKQLNEKEAKIKNYAIENSILNEKLKNLSSENQELNNNIDELDKQHNSAVEKLLDVKNELQEKYNQIKHQHDQLEQRSMEYGKKYENLVKTFELESENLKKNLSLIESENRELQKTSKTQEMKNQTIEELLKFKDQELEELSKNKKQELGELSKLQDQGLKNEELQKSLEAQEIKLKSLEEDLKLKDEELFKLTNRDLEREKEQEATLMQINTLINSHFKLNEPFETSAKFIEKFTGWILKTSSKLRELDFEISKLMDENKLVKEETSRVLHEKEVLKADLINYEIECSELMKNNNILMADIENLKCVGKLETIPENDDEDNIVILEKQLEDTASLNQSLEEEFQLLKEKVGTLEKEKIEQVQKIKNLEAKLTELSIKSKEDQLEIENLENEKCNYLFELNELKSEDERNILQKELKEYKARSIELGENFEKLKIEYESLSIKYNTLYTDSQQKLSEIVLTQQESGRLLQEKQNQLQNASHKLENLEKLGEELKLIKGHNSELQNQISALNGELERSILEKQKLEKQVAELVNVNEINLESLKKSQELIQNLQHNLLNNNVEELRQETQDLKEIINQVSVEKENLIGLVKTKHEENVNYHNEIVRLNNLLANTNLHSGEKQEELQVIKEEFKNALQKLEVAENELHNEHNKRKFLEKERSELSEQNSGLNKDIERLRQHLLEVADEYTLQTVDLQKSVDEYKNKLIAIEEEAKKSATAYTSAR